MTKINNVTVCSNTKNSYVNYFPSDFQSHGPLSYLPPFVQEESLHLTTGTGSFMSQMSFLSPNHSVRALKRTQSTGINQCRTG